MVMKQSNSTELKKRPWRVDADWTLKMQPLAIAQFYSKVWPGAQIIELDQDKRNKLAVALDIGGADKMICFSGGALVFLGQRFRRWNQRKFDDFTIRRDRPSGIKTEFHKVKLALEHGGFIAGYYSYGHANKGENGFIRFRILKFREVIEAILVGELCPTVRYNPDNSSSFYVLPFDAIPPRYFLLDYTANKHQLKLPI